MENTIILSVIVPAYNSEAFIEEAILSFLSQYISCAEMIIVDDGSKDKTYEVCKPWLSNHIKYYRTENLGAGHARNYGIARARGEWVGFLDSDDLIEKDSIKKVFEVLKSQRASYDIVYCSKINCNMDFSNKYIVRAEPIESIVNKIPTLEFWSCLYSRAFLKNNGVEFFEYREQDIESAFRFRAFSKTERVLVCNDIVLVVHRNNPDSNVNTWNQITLNRIKAKVYLQLFREYDFKEVSVSNNLYSVFIKCFAKLMWLLIKEGIGKMQIIKDDILTLKEGLKYRHIVKASLKYRFAYFFVKITSSKALLKIVLSIRGE